MLFNDSMNQWLNESMMRATLLAGCAVLACVVILLADYVVASRRAQRDDQLIKSLQQQVRTEAALAPKLAAEQQRITTARRARKSRDNAVGWLLIGAVAFFLTSAKRIVPASRPVRQQQTRTHTVSKARHTRTSALPGLDLTFVDELVRRAVTNGESREAAIVLLQAIQSHYRYLPDEALLRVCELTGITPAQITGTASFYGQFRRNPVGKHMVRVCHGTACHVAGARQITDELHRYLAIPGGADTDTEGMFTLDQVACLGCCSLAPVFMVDGHTAGRLTPSSACDELEKIETLSH
jgi:NADH:ubiquinone oxidoreductase subunit E